MSNVTFVSLALFLETLTAVIAFVGFCALLREYLRRRQRHLLFFALAAISLSLSHAGMFFGQVLGAFEQTDLTDLLIFGFEHGAATQALFVLLGLVDLYVAKPRRGLAMLTASVLPLASLGALFFTAVEVTSLYGFAVPSLSTGQDLLILASNMLVGIALVAAGLTVIRESGNKPSPERAFVFAGTSILLALLVRYTGGYFEQYWALPLSSLVYAFFSFALSLGAIAKGHPDPVIAANPPMFIKKRLLYKAAGFNTLLFWFLSFFLVFVTSSYFISASVESRRVGLRKDVHFFSRSFAASGVQFLEETSTLAALRSLPSVIGTDPESLPPVIKEFVRKDGRQRIIRIVDRDGIIVFSSYSEEEIGATLDSSVLRKALGGTKVAATEHEDTVKLWALRAAVPLEFEDGTLGGVVLTTDLGVALDFSDYTAISPVLASGYGYVTETGAIAYSSGDSIDEITKSHSRRALGSQAYAFVRLQTDDEVHLEHTYASDGTPNGFFYAIVRQALVSDYAFRIMAVVMLIMHLALAVVILILVFTMSLVLRPIKELQAATRRVERDEYDVHIGYGIPDEIGELAMAFNRMSGAIAERTTKLRQSVREQQDFLEHSVRDMRTPINVFRWTLELMRFGDTGRLNRQQLEFLEQMNQTNERLMHMVQNLQDVSRLDQGKFAFSLDHFGLEEILDEAAGEFSVAMREKSIALHWKRPSEPLPRAKADRAAIKKAVLNILSNAVKYNQTNGHIEMSVAPAIEDSPDGKKGRFLKVTIEDSGRGIPVDEHERIFDRFFRARNVIGDEIEGAGLGLHISKRMVELQGGKIWFESKEGRGSTFQFTVPADPKS